VWKGQRWPLPTVAVPLSRCYDTAALNRDRRERRMSKFPHKIAAGACRIFILSPGGGPPMENSHGARQREYLQSTLSLKQVSKA